MGALAPFLVAIEQVLIDKDKFVDFFEYYDGKPEQLTGIELLYFQIKASNPTLLAKNADWMEAYRGNSEPPPADKPPAVAAKWPLTKAELGEIMLCSADSLPDSLMDDLAACCEDFGINTKKILGYFLGQCGHESAGLRYPMEIASGSAYEFRTDLGNVHPGDGVKYAGTGWIQVTGRANHQDFADYLAQIGKPDPKIMEIGKTYTCEVYPWSISGNWWLNNNMNEYCLGDPDIDRVGQRVNGRYLPNGYQDRRDYTNRAFRVLGV